MATLLLACVHPTEAMWRASWLLHLVWTLEVPELHYLYDFLVRRHHPRFASAFRGTQPRYVRQRGCGQNLQLKTCVSQGGGNRIFIRAIRSPIVSPVSAQKLRRPPPAVSLSRRPAFITRAMKNYKPIWFCSRPLLLEARKTLCNRSKTKPTVHCSKQPNTHAFIFRRWDTMHGYCSETNLQRPPPASACARVHATAET